MFIKWSNVWVIVPASACIIGEIKLPEIPTSADCARIYNMFIGIVATCYFIYYAVVNLCKKIGL
jgi:hypothetical protein